MMNCSKHFSFTKCCECSQSLVKAYEIKQDTTNYNHKLLSFMPRQHQMRDPIARFWNDIMETKLKVVRRDWEYVDFTSKGLYVQANKMDPQQHYVLNGLRTSTLCVCGEK